MAIDNFGQLLTTLATKAGIPETDPNLINVLTNAELTKVPLHSDLAKALDENLLSLEAAMNNHPKIKGQYHSQALNGVDKKVEEMITEYSLPEEKAAEIRAIKSSYERVTAITRAVAEAQAAKAGGQTKEDKSALQKQVDELLGKLKEAETASATQVEEVKKTYTEKLKSRELDVLLSGIKTIYDELPPKTRKAAIMEHIEKELQDKKASFTFDENEVFTLKGEGDTTVVGANHQAYTPLSFIESTLANNKILKVAEPPKKPETPQVITGNPAGPTGNNQTAILNRQRREAYDQAQVATT